MNRAYRFVWSKAKGCWDIASEITKGNGGPRTAGAVIARHSLLSAAILFAPLSAWAGPAGEQVVAGVASISRPDARTTWISQQSDKAIINWNSFSIAGPELVRFQQPGAGSIALNRVTGPDPSQIFGQLQANGQIFLVNPNGVLFAPGSQVSVHGLLATTHNIANDDFLAGRYSFSRLEGLPDAEVINQGLLEAAEGGYIVLAGDYAANTGVIQARLGQVALASGNRFTLDLEGDQLIGLAVDEASLARRAGVENFGELSADGGRVLMTARVAGELTSAVVNNEGLIRARTIEERNGEILLLGGMENGRFTEQNTVRVGGTLDASAPDGGDGGFVETSAYHLEFDNPVVTAAAPYGKGGEWLIDPNNITIQATGPDSNLSGNPDFTTTADSAIITTATVESALNAGTSVTITTGTSGGDSQEGNITVSSAISKSNGSDATLTLSAHNNIDVNAAISSTSNKLHVTLNADSDASGAGSLAMNAGSSIISNGGSINLKGVSIGSSGNPFRLSPGSVTGLGTVTATATATTGGGIYLEQMSGDAYSSKYIFNVPGGGQVIDLYTTDGNMIFDSLGSYENVIDDYITLTTAGTSKNITFNNGINFYAAGLTMNGTGSVNFEAGTVTLNTPVTANLPVNIASGNILTLMGSGNFTSTLSLGADAALTANGTLALAASPTLGAGAKVGITTSGADILTIGGELYTVINSLGSQDSTTALGLQGMNGGLSGRYALGSDIDASGTSGWNSEAGFVPVGNITPFTGAFDGLGHTITGLTINRPNTDYVGLFGYSLGRVQNIGLTNLAINGSYFVGGLVGMNYGTISNSHASGTISGRFNVGGLVGANFGSGIISDSYAGGSVSATMHIGGLVGRVGGTILNSHYNINTTSLSVLSVGGERLLAEFVSVGGLYNTQYEAWIGNGKSLTIENYFYLSNGYYGIETTQNLQDLLGFADNSSYSFRLVADLDLSTIPGWHIPYFAAAVFDGSGHTLSNLKLAQTFQDKAGLIGELRSGSIITNLGLLNVDVRAYAETGGLVGSSYGTISNSYVTGTVSGSEYAVGGLVGRNQPGSAISGSYATATVSGNTQVGGLVGDNYNYSTISNSYAIGAVSEGTQVGGLVGKNSGTITASYWNTETSGQTSSAGGTGLTTTQMKAAANFSDWDLMDTWRIYEGYTYPLLKSFLTPLVVTAEDVIKTYNGLNWTTSLQNVSYSIASAPDSENLFNIDTPYGTAVNAAVYSPQLYSNQQGYDISFVGGILTVGKAPLTITAENQNKIYGAPDPSLTATYSGFQSTDNATVISGLNLNTATGAEATAGFHTITAADATAANYQISYTTGILTVDKAALTITADDKTKVYGATDPTLTASYGTFYYDDTSAVVSGLGLSTATGSSATAGTHTITAANATADNYQISYTTGILTVDKAALTITADDKAKVYGAADPTLTASYGTLFYGDTSAVISGLNLSTATGAAATAGNHTITAANATAANYTITHQDGTLTVDKAALTITADDKAKVYGAADPTLTASYGTFYYGDDASVISGLSLSTATGAAAIAGMHTITAADATAANYQISYTTGILTVDKAALTITADNKAKVYGAADPTLTASYGTFYYGDTSAVVSGLNLSTATGAEATAGMHTITASNATAANYQISYTDGTLTVDKAALTITADDKAKVYGATDPILTASYGTFYYGDDASIVSGLNLSTATGAEATAGMYTITASNGMAANYTISYTDGTLTVDKAALTITVDNKAKVYGAADPTLTASYGTFYYGDDASIVSGLNLNTATGAEATAGMHTITASNATAANYQISYTDGTLTVDKAALIITADNKAKVYGATGPTLTASYGTFSYSDDASVVSGLSLNTATDADATAGNHAITAANATAANYQISYTDGTLTVDKAALTITADNQSKIYGATDPTPTASYSTFYYDDDASVISGLNLSTVTGAEATAGTHTITAANASAANYTITHQDGTLTVDRRVVNAALNGEVGKIYDGTVIATLGNNYTLDIISGDSVVLAATGSYDTRHVGTNKSVDFTGLSLSGDDAGNYLLQTATLSGNIGVIRQLSSVTWTGGATGNWSAAANWAGGALPDGGNVAAVSIPANTAVTFDAATAITGLDTLNVETGGSLILAGSTLDIATSLTTPIYSQTGGTLSGAGSLNVSNSFSKTGGSLALSGPLNIIQAEGNLSFSNPVPVFLGAITVNAGNIAIEATGGLTTGSSLVAAPSGTISLTALSPLTIGSGGVLAANGVSLTAGSGNGELVVNGAVVSSNGPITMTGDSIAQNADINAGSGSVSATANSGSIILASNVTTTGGSISYTASGPINYSSAGQFVGPTPSLFANTADQTQAPQSVLSETSQAVLATVTDLVQQDTIIPAAVADEPAAPTQTASSTQTEEEQKKKEETAEVIENQSQTPLQTKPIFDLASGGVAGQQMVCK